MTRSIVALTALTALVAAIGLGSVKPVAAQSGASTTPTAQVSTMPAGAADAIALVAQLWHDGKIPPEAMAKLFAEMKYRDAHGLTEADYSKLQKIWTAGHNRRSKLPKPEREYWLPADDLLSNPELDLTVDQERQLENLRETFRPKIQDALADLWKQRDELNAQSQKWLEAIQADPSVQTDPKYRQDVTANSEKLAAVNKKIDEAKKPVNADYMTKAQGVLTPGQVAIMNATVALQSKLPPEGPFANLKGKMISVPATNWKMPPDAAQPANPGSYKPGQP